MDYIQLPHMDNPVSVFDICQAHRQLESDYNTEGMLWERPSNRRRNSSTSCQLARMRYSSPYGWVDIIGDDPEGDDVRDIYLINVLKWELPMDDEMLAFVQERYTENFLAKFGVVK